MPRVRIYFPVFSKFQKTEAANTVGWFMLKTISIGYLLIIHILILVMLMKTDFIDRVKIKMGFPENAPELTHFYNDMVAYHKRVDPNLPDKSVIFIGDSFIQSLAVTAISPYGVNYGIGGDTTVGVLERLPFYASLKRAGKIILAIGGNDLTRRTPEGVIANYKDILESMPSLVEVVVVGMHPIDEKVKIAPGRTNESISIMNSMLKNLCSHYSNVAFFEMADQLRDSQGNLKLEYHEGDGIHLSQEGYKIWIEQFNKTISFR